MKNKFTDTVVILAAGRGTRMGSEMPKVLLEIGGKPVLQYAIDFWKKEGVGNFIFVLGYKKDAVLSFLEKSGLNKYDTVYQEEQKGIAHALSYARPLIKDKFIVSLGDCLHFNNSFFTYPERMDNGYGLWRGNYQKQLSLCCSAWVENEQVVRVVEKGRAPYVGIGTYFFDKRVFDYIEKAKPSSYRNETEITEVLQNMIDAGERLKPVFLDGEFINLTYPEDIKYAEQLIKAVK